MCKLVVKGIGEEGIRRGDGDTRREGGGKCQVQFQSCPWSLTT